MWRTEAIVAMPAVVVGAAVVLVAAAAATTTVVDAANGGFTFLRVLVAAFSSVSGSLTMK
jgi:hypothetical protein